MIPTHSCLDDEANLRDVQINYNGVGHLGKKHPSLDKESRLKIDNFIVWLCVPKNVVPLAAR